MANPPRLYIPVPAPVVETSRLISRDWALLFDQIVRRLQSGGDVVGPGSSTDGGVVLFDGATGSVLKQATGTGLVNVSAGVYQTPFQASAASTLVGRGSASGAGNWQEITLGSGLTMTATTLSSSGSGADEHFAFFCGGL